MTIPLPGQVDLFTGETLKGDAPKIRLKGIKPSASRKLRAMARIQAGFHPFGFPLKKPASEKCRGCRFAVRKNGGGQKFWKCEKSKMTSGPATDLRLKWPACILWEAEK